MDTMCIVRLIFSYAQEWVIKRYSIFFALVWFLLFGWTLQIIIKSRICFMLNLSLIYVLLILWVTLKGFVLRVIILNLLDNIVLVKIENLFNSILILRTLPFMFEFIEMVFTTSTDDWLFLITTYLSGFRLILMRSSR